MNGLFQPGNAPELGRHPNTNPIAEGWPRCGLVASLLLLLSWTAQAHDSPQQVIRDLTSQMARQGKSPEFLFQRATEYQVLNRLDLAAHDLHEALRLAPSFIPARYELGRVCLDQNRAGEALRVIGPALDLATDSRERGRLYLLRAEIYLAMRQCESALADANRAVQLQPEHLESYLIRSRILRQMGRAADAVEGLRTGHQKTGSFVLEIEWIEALIDAGQHQAALDRIQPHLRAARWRGSWLLRRGRARLGLGPEHHQAALADLREALLEINQRLDLSRSDMTLLAERGLARALLGNHSGAERDLRVVRESRAGSWLAQRLEAALAR